MVELFSKQHYIWGGFLWINFKGRGEKNSAYLEIYVILSHGQAALLNYELPSWFCFDWVRVTHCHNCRHFLMSVGLGV